MRMPARPSASTPTRFAAATMMPPASGNPSLMLHPCCRKRPNPLKMTALRPHPMRSKQFTPSLPNFPLPMLSTACPMPVHICERCTKKAACFVASRFIFDVEVAGFEPATFWSRRALTNSPLSESAILLISPQVFHNSVGLQRRFYAVFRVFSPNFSPNSPPQPVPISAAWPSEK